MAFNFKDPFLSDFWNADVYSLAYKVQVPGVRSKWVYQSTESAKQVLNCEL